MSSWFRHPSMDRALLALAVSGSLVLGACSTTVTELARRPRTARVQLESIPPGATVLVGGRKRGTTPTTVALEYTEVDEEVTNHGDRVGGILGILGGAALGASGAMLVVLMAVVDSLAHEDDVNQNRAGAAVLYGFGGAGVVAGLVTIGYGIYLLATAAKKRTRVLPTDGLTFGLRPATGPALQLRVDGTGSPPPFDRLRVLRFDGTTKRWQTPGLPRQLSLEMRTPDGWVRAPVTDPPASAKSPAKRKPAQEPDVPRMVRPLTF